MKLATVKVEYTCGLTLTDRVTLNVSTGELHLPPRLTEVMAAVGKSECPPAISLEYLGYVLPVEVGPDGSYDVSLPPAPPAGFRRALHSISYPTKDQRQQTADCFTRWQRRPWSERLDMLMPLSSGIGQRFSTPQRSQALE
jgi:hypothetical protein